MTNFILNLTVRKNPHLRKGFSLNEFVAVS